MRKSKKTIKERFNELKEQYPYLSTYTIFSQTVQERIYSLQDIKKSFNKLVDKDDYSSREKEQILSYLNKFHISTLTNKKERR